MAKKRRKKRIRWGKLAVCLLLTAAVCVGLSAWNDIQAESGFGVVLSSEAEARKEGPSEARTRFKAERLSFEELPQPEPEPDWRLTLVNRWNPITEYREVETVTLSNGEKVDARIYPELQQMFDDARAEGVYMIVRSGYRTPEDQQDIYDSRIREYEAQGYSAADAKKETEKWVAIPGTSEHQLGLSLDINADGVHSKGSDVYAWLQIHAADYGFIYRFPADKVAVTGISNEPWHYRYVGVELAHAIKDSGLCLEEYVAALEEDKAA